MFGLSKFLRFAQPATLKTKRLTQNYRVFDSSFDHVCSAHQLFTNLIFPRAQLKAAKAHYAAHSRTIAPILRTIHDDALHQAGLAPVLVPDIDISVTILIDHSGSMRGDRALLACTVAQSVATLCAALDISCEVLGFTTVEWRGEPVRPKWQRLGSPPDPGRLCALRHIVYSDFSDPSLPNLAALFIPDLLKENVDGEALLWAAERADKSSRASHLVCVISDGAPVDDATLFHNHNTILYDHLKHVIEKLSKDQKYRLAGLGIEHDTSAFYASSLQVNSVEDVQDQLVRFIFDQLGPTEPPPQFKDL